MDTEPQTEEDVNSDSQKVAHMTLRNFLPFVGSSKRGKKLGLKYTSDAFEPSSFLEDRTAEL